MSATSLHRDGGRYLAAGAINTAATSLVYLVGLLALPPGWAYALAWLAGLAIVVKFYPEKVFVAGRRGLGDRALLGLVTVANFLLGLFLLSLLTGTGLGPVLAFACVLAATTVAGFAASRLLLRRGGAA